MMPLAQAYMELSQDIPVADPKVEQRLLRAYDIVRTTAYAITAMGNGVYTVYKVQDRVTYTVDKVSCNCIDYMNARANLCKHRLAVKLWEKVNI